MIKKPGSTKSDLAYRQFATGIADLLTAARRQTARSLNTILTTTYWETGRRIIEFEQGGKARAGYGEAVLVRLSKDLIRRFGRGFSVDHLELMRKFYLSWPVKRNSESVIRNSNIFPLSWTHYTRLLRVSNILGRNFYEQEAVRGGWSVRQLDRQICSQFFERTALSRNKTSMLLKGRRIKPIDQMTPEEEIKNPYMLEFLGLKDEYSESELEEGLIRHLESFLLELGGEFTFVARQKRLRVGSAWYRIDLVFYHRRLRCLVLVDLKICPLTHADAGQMHLYLNYAKEHWTLRDENPPVGLILCAEKDAEVAHYALQGLPNKVLASQYKTTLPQEKKLVAELKETQRILQTRQTARLVSVGKPARRHPPHYP